MASTEAAAGRVRHSWLHRHDGNNISYAHMAMLEAFTAPGGEALLAGAFQASGAGCEGAEAQHLRFCLSRDGGESWEPSVALMWGLQVDADADFHGLEQGPERLVSFLSAASSLACTPPIGSVVAGASLPRGHAAAVPLLQRESQGPCPRRPILLGGLGANACAMAAGQDSLSPSRPRALVAA